MAKKQSDKERIASIEKKIADNTTTDIQQVNGYGIRYNPMFKTWQVSHPDIGANIEEFKTEEEAVSHAVNGSKKQADLPAEGYGNLMDMLFEFLTGNGVESADDPQADPMLDNFINKGASKIPPQFLPKKKAVTDTTQRGWFTFTEGTPGYMYIVHNDSLYTGKKEGRGAPQEYFRITKDSFFDKEALDSFANTLQMETGFDLLQSLALSASKTASSDDLPPQYTKLSDAPTLPEGSTKIWYTTRDSFRDMPMGLEFLEEQRDNPNILNPPTRDTLDQTHVLLGEIGLTEPNDIYRQMQGESWSPEGEAVELIKGLGTHTSMSMGDIIEMPDGELLFVDYAGFANLNSRKVTADFDPAYVEKGTDIEHEHKPTYELIEDALADTGELPAPVDMYEGIAKDHLKEQDEYYDEEIGLPAMEEGLEEEKDIERLNAKMTQAGDVGVGVGDIEMRSATQQILKKFYAFMTEKGISNRDDEGAIEAVNEFVALQESGSKVTASYCLEKLGEWDAEEWTGLPDENGNPIPEPEKKKLWERFLQKAKGVIDLDALQQSLMIRGTRRTLDVLKKLSQSYPNNRMFTATGYDVNVDKYGDMSGFNDYPDIFTIEKTSSQSLMEGVAVAVHDIYPNAKKLEHASADWYEFYDLKDNEQFIPQVQVHLRYPEPGFGDYFESWLPDTLENLKKEYKISVSKKTGAKNIVGETQGDILRRLMNKKSSLNKQLRLRTKRQET